MCGIFGFVSSKNKLDDLKVKQICKALHHRGPDATGYIKQDRLLFLHTRLSIQDLSSNASQPMISQKNTMITFNGEIYNHHELRQKLKNLNYQINWKSNSDTETLLKCIDIFGIEKTLKMVEGMFAFGYWDKQKKKLIIAVDRFSEKPLYYSSQKNNFFFTSDLKTIQDIDVIDKKISKTGLSNLIRKNYIPHPHSIYKNIRKLSPGTYKEYFFDENYKINKVNTERYWNINEEYINSTLIVNKKINYKQELDSLLRKVIKSQLISDVPVGCFLSGGLDSSLIAYLMNKVSQEKKINTFSIGFTNKEYDESYYSNIVAKKINSNHHLKIFDDRDLIKLVPQLSNIYSEPFADSSQLPTALISSFANLNGMKVVLTGDGGDELFGGYMRYYWSNKISNSNIPKFLIKSIKKIFSLFPEKNLDEVFYILRFILPKKYRVESLSSKIRKILEMMSIDEIEKVYEVLTTNKDYEKIFNFENSFLKNDINYFFRNESFSRLDDTDKMMLFDLNKYLPGDILPKVDRASMHSSLETRAPFLNQNVVKFALSLDKNLKLSNGKGKIIIKDLMSQYFSQDFLNRPKKGFGIPLAHFLRNELKQYVLDTIENADQRSKEFINLTNFRKIFDEHCKGKDHKELIWSTISFLSWQNQQ